MKRRALLATLGLVGSSGCLWLEETEPSENGSNGNPSTDDESSATSSNPDGGPAPEVTLAEHWTAEHGIDYIWTEGVKLYYNSFNTAAEATHGEGVLWAYTDVAYEEDTENLGANAFATDGRYAIYAFTPDHEVSRCHFQAYETVEEEKAWAFRVPDFEAFASPVGVTIVDDVAIIAANVTVPTGESTVWGLDLGTGEEVWQADGELTDRYVSFLGSFDGVVYVGTINGGTFVLDPSDGRLLERHESWEVQMIRGGSAGGRIHQASLFAVTSGGLVAYPLDDGGVEWTTDEVTGSTTGPVVDNELVVVGTDEGEVLAFERDSGRQRWVQRIDGEVNAVELTGLRVWAADSETSLVAYDRGDGTSLHQSTQPINGSDIGISNGVIVFGGDTTRAFTVEEE